MSWSDRLSKHFCLTLPEDLAAWLDGRAWREDGLLWTPIEPERLLDELDSLVPGGLMLPDCLPFFQDGAGGSLCLRLNADGSAAYWVAYFSSGLPWQAAGNSLVDALLYDAVRGLVEDPECAEDEELWRHADWAMRRVIGRARRGTFMRAYGSEEHPPEALLAAGIAEIPLRRERCEECLRGELARSMEFGLSGALDIDYHWLNRLSWDTTLVPDALIPRLEKSTGVPAAVLLRQDWDGAGREAARVAQLCPDLAWPHHVLGRAAEIRGDFEAAISHYADGLETLGSSSAFTEEWCPFEGPGHWKYSVYRLAQLREQWPSCLCRSRYLAAAVADGDGGATPAVRDFWLQEGEAAEGAGCSQEAYRCYLYAGWDHLLSDDDTPRILEGLGRSAEAAGSHALAMLARAHLQSLAEMNTGPSWIVPPGEQIISDAPDLPPWGGLTGDGADPE